MRPAIPGETCNSRTHACLASGRCADRKIPAEQPKESVKESLLTHAHCSNALWGLANVFYLAYLPVLVDVHEDVVRYEGQEAPTETEKGRE